MQVELGQCFWLFKDRSTTIYLQLPEMCLDQDLIVALEGADNFYHMENFFLLQIKFTDLNEETVYPTRFPYARFLWRLMKVKKLQIEIVVKVDIPKKTSFYENGKMSMQLYRTSPTSHQCVGYFHHLFKSRYFRKPQEFQNLCITLKTIKVKSHDDIWEDWLFTSDLDGFTIMTHLPEVWYLFDSFLGLPFKQ